MLEGPTVEEFEIEIEGGRSQLLAGERPSNWLGLAILSSAERRTFGPSDRRRAGS